MSSVEIIQYVPFSSFVDPAFWHTLTRVKLDVDQLEEKERDITGYFSYRDDLPAMLEVDGTSFNRVPQSPPFYTTMPGTLINKNTIENFKHVDKAQLLNEAGQKHWQLIQTKSWIAEPSQLLRFIVLVFADLKKYYYYYWFAYPVPSQPTVSVRATKPLCDIFTQTQISEIADGFKALDKSQKSCFVILAKNKVEVKTLLSILSDNAEHIKEDGVYIAFLDPSNGSNPGWPLRNLIAALLDHCPSLIGADLSTVGLRCKMNGSIEPSMYFQVNIPEDVAKTESSGWVGWERNDQGKLIPKLANMSASMDPIRLAEDSADLNLKLMKWRVVPNIDLDVLKETKCLLLGAGTLGCQVARSLLAWGFRHITFLDNGKVSYSNPVRQVLFTHKDCQNGGLKKALAAADNLKRILPSVNSSGIVCHIPMPGHPVGDSVRQETEDSIRTITKAVSEHDIVFLLLDTREARWLPTLLGAHFNKLVINAALGFDSYLVLRHGANSSETIIAAPVPSTEYVAGQGLGCYFCNDVTAPGNSLKDRTLDQQCTVTRPGVSAIAGALAVEMAVALLQHRLGINAPAAYNLGRSIEQGLNPDAEGILGPIPHSIRGFLWSHHTAVPTCVKFKQCVACSETVVKEYRTNGTEFLFKVFGDASHLERVTGLTELHLAAELVDVMVMGDDDEMTDSGSDKN